MAACCFWGILMHEAWQLKRNLSAKVSNSEIDGYYELAQTHGAIGGKLLGAGGGGFLLLIAAPECHAEIRQALKLLIYVPFSFEFGGSQIIFVDRQEDFASIERDPSALL